MLRLGHTKAQSMITYQSTKAALSSLTFKLTNGDCSSTGRWLTGDVQVTASEWRQCQCPNSINDRLKTSSTRKPSIDQVINCQVINWQTKTSDLALIDKVVDKAAWECTTHRGSTVTVDIMGHDLYPIIWGFDVDMRERLLVSQCHIDSADFKFVRLMLFATVATGRGWGLRGNGWSQAWRWRWFNMASISTLEGFRGQCACSGWWCGKNYVEARRHGHTFYTIWTIQYCLNSISQVNGVPSRQYFMNTALKVLSRRYGTLICDTIKHFLFDCSFIFYAQHRKKFVRWTVFKFGETLAYANNNQTN